MRFNQPTDYSPGTGNTVLLRCQLSSCHPPSQHMGCVRSKKAAEQLSAEFLPPCPLQLSEVIGAPGSSQSCLQQCREYKVRQEHRKGMTLPLLPGLSISAWFKGSSWAQENIYTICNWKQNFTKCLCRSWRNAQQITSDLTPSACPFPSSALLPVLLNWAKIFLHIHLFWYYFY